MSVPSHTNQLGSNVADLYFCSPQPQCMTWDHGYRASALCNVYCACLCPRFCQYSSSYPQRNDQADLTWMPSPYRPGPMWTTSLIESRDQRITSKPNHHTLLYNWYKSNIQLNDLDFEMYASQFKIQIQCNIHNIHILPKWLSGWVYVMYELWQIKKFILRQNSK